ADISSSTQNGNHFHSPAKPVSFLPDSIPAFQLSESVSFFFLRIVLLAVSAQEPRRKCAAVPRFLIIFGDNLVHQSISLLQVKDPYFKRTGASRLTRFAVDDDRRMKVVELGGAQELVNMLQAAKDDRTRKAALEALAALSNSDKVVGALQEFGAVSIVESTPSSVEEADIDKYKTSILKRFKDMRKDESS
ncbi:hypothetical protein LINPERHAP1_LOCUS2227, partial [Linum perenne]